MWLTNNKESFLYTDLYGLWNLETSGSDVFRRSWTFCVATSHRLESFFKINERPAPAIENVRTDKIF
jgi:hypothetical protein